MDEQVITIRFHREGYVTVEDRNSGMQLFSASGKNVRQVYSEVSDAIAIVVRNKATEILMRAHS